MDTKNERLDCNEVQINMNTIGNKKVDGEVVTTGEEVLKDTIAQTLKFILDGDEEQIAKATDLILDSIQKDEENSLIRFNGPGFLLINIDNLKEALSNQKTQAQVPENLQARAEA